MSLSTTCSLFWVSVNDNVVEVDTDNAVCDSTYTSCTITGSHGGTLQATCNSEQQYPDTTSSYYSSYFCACNGNSVTVPSGVTCSPSCYDLTTSFPSCNLVWLYNGFTSGSASNFVKQDTCAAFTCDSSGIECTDSSAKLLYQCDNEEHQSQVESDSNDSYVCDCQGAAQIPELYRGTSGASAGSGCSDDSTGGGGGSTTSTQQAGAGAVTATTVPSGEGEGSTGTQQQGAGVATATTPPSQGETSTTTQQPGLGAATTTATPFTSPSSDSPGSASTRSTFSRCIILSLCSSFLLRLLRF